MGYRGTLTVSHVVVRFQGPVCLQFQFDTTFSGENPTAFLIASAFVSSHHAALRGVAFAARLGSEALLGWFHSVIFGMPARFPGGFESACLMFRQLRKLKQ
jgi:hypothetical protein